MKNRYFYLLGGMIAALGVPVLAQTIYPVPARVFGQYNQPKTPQELVSPPSTAPNLLEGRELYSPQAVAVDPSSRTIYVVDAGNNRVLGWKDSSTYTNGARADIVLGQKDMQGNLAYTNSLLSSPNVGLFSPSSGLYTPSAVAVDRNGNVFVMDSGNNRILRYPTPTVPRDNGGPVLADLVIGQPNLISSTANRGNLNTINESGIRTNATSTQGSQSAGLAFDAAGNLWFADAGNHRLLRYDAKDVSGSSNTSSDGATIRANYVLGQMDLSSANPNLGRLNSSADRINKSQLRFPNGIAFDASGDLFAIDDLGRVLVYQPPFDTPGKPASRILGIYPALAAGQPAPPATNDFTLGTFASGNTLVGGPKGIFTVGDYIFVCDTANNRMVRWDPVSTPWAPESADAISPRMSDPYTLYGQDDYNRNEPNGVTGWEPSAKYLDGPVAGAFLNGELYIVDSRNNRVLVHPYNTDWNFLSPATRIIGQVDFPFRSINLIEGREFGIGSIQLSSTLRVNLGIGMALDSTSPDAQRLYIADTLNHRILGYANARKAQTGDVADLVIGQVDFYRSIPNSPGGDPQKTNAGGLALPSAVVVDSQGNLWVADTGNGRVLRFPKPFDNPAGPFVADRVIGQPDLTTRTDGVPARNRLYRPAALALTPEGNLVVSDIGHNRVLLYRAPFDSDGPDAQAVAGQPDFETGTSGSDDKLTVPMGVAVDTSGRLYVADTGNSRLVIYDNINAVRYDKDNGLTGVAPRAFSLPITGGQPLGVTVSTNTGQIFVPASTTSVSRVYRYPQYDQLLISGNTTPDPAFVMSEFVPRSVILDPLDNLFVADSANRITMHYPQLGVVNGVNGFPRVAPAMMGLLRASGVTFSTDGGTASGREVPKQLADVEVLVDGVAAPLTQVDRDNVRLIVPKSTAITGLSDFLVRRVSTGQILAYTRVSMTNISPAVLFQDSNPGAAGQARAFNQDGTANSGGNAASSGQELTVLLTGQGAFDGLPDDGLAPGSAVPIPDTPRAFIRVGAAVAECTVLSSTLDPDQPGLWRVKVKVPQVNAAGTFGFFVLYKSLISDSFTNPTMTVRPTVTVKP